MGKEARKLNRALRKEAEAREQLTPGRSLEMSGGRQDEEFIITKRELSELMRDQRTKGAVDSLLLMEMALRGVFGFGQVRINRLAVEIERLGEEQIKLPLAERMISGVLKFNALHSRQGKGVTVT